MKGRIVKELKYKYNVRKINGRKVELYNFYTLCFFLEQAEQGVEFK
jgi:hypothetical protein